MKTLTQKNRLAEGMLALLVFVASVSSASANIVGYVNYTFQPGANLFGNPLANTDALLSTLFPGTAPAGTTISVWDAGTSQYSQTSEFDGSTWSVDFSLDPGTGALLVAPALFTNTFVGNVLDASGGLLTDTGGGGFNVNPPPAFGGPNGIYLWNSKMPVGLPFTTGPTDSPANTTYDAFTLLVGRNPQDGEQVWRFNRGLQAFDVTTYSAGAWDNGAPSMNVGEAAFFNLGPVASVPYVPEPSVLALLGLAGLMLRLVCGTRLKQSKA